MIRPFSIVQPGGQLSANELNRAFSELVRSSRSLVGAPLQISRNWGGERLTLDLPIGSFVRIIAGYGGSGSGSSPAYFYSGVQQYSLADGTVDDNPMGIVFDAETYPLVEMTKNAAVTSDAIVWAWPAASRDHWEFVAEEGGGTTACTCCCCCVKCSSAIWLTVSNFTSNACGLSVPIGFDTFQLSKVGPCWICSRTLSLNVYNGHACTLTVIAKLCCDPNDKRHCPLLTIRSTLTILEGPQKGTYNFCIGPIDMTVSASSCASAAAWGASVSSDAIACDPYNQECQCPISFADFVPINAKCVCPFCSTIPSTIAAVLTCNLVVDGVVPVGVVNFSLVSTPDPGDQTINAYGQCASSWIATGTAANGCTLHLAVSCALDGTLVASLACDSTGCTGGGCTAVQTALSNCGFGSISSGAISCDPFGVTLTGSGGGTLVLGSGSPTGEAMPSSDLSGEVFWLSAQTGGIWQNITGTTPATNGDGVSLWVEPDDNPTSPVDPYAYNTSPPTIGTPTANNTSGSYWLYGPMLFLNSGLALSGDFCLWAAIDCDFSADFSVFGNDGSPAVNAEIRISTDGKLHIVDDAGHAVATATQVCKSGKQLVRVRRRLGQLYVATTFVADTAVGSSGALTTITFDQLWRGNVGGTALATHGIAQVIISTNSTVATTPPVWIDGPSGEFQVNHGVYIP